MYSASNINECELNSTLCRSFEKCTNRPGDYICEPKLRCEWGYQLNSNGTACDDVDECKLKAFNCRHGQICVNTPGAYKCEDSPCHYSESVVDLNKTDNISEIFPVLLVDINKCTGKGASNICQSGICVNIPGSFRCDCPTGFRLGKGGICVDINECHERDGICTSRHTRGIIFSCVNLYGSYRCVSERCPAMYMKTKIPNAYRCTLMAEYECNTFDPYCLKDRPLRMDHLHVELPAILTKRLVLGELDSSLVKRGTINIELLEHYAYDTRTKRHISVRNSLKLGVKPSDRRTVELLLVKPIDPPADIFVSVRLSEMLGQRSKVRSTTRFYLYATENSYTNLTTTGNDMDDWRNRK
ncbi:hypothetical protein Aperf_G00000091255 [Anoplocephala perfoliata]